MALVTLFLLLDKNKSANRRNELVKSVNEDFVNATILVITPTYKRPKRLIVIILLFLVVADVGSCFSLRWIVVEDGMTTVPAVSRILQRSGVPHAYLATILGDEMPRRGWTLRNLALQYVKENYYNHREAVLYFSNDDNFYDVRLFNDYIRKVNRIGVWAAGLVGGAWVEAPRFSANGKVIVWDAMFAPGRPFSIDMDGFKCLGAVAMNFNASFNTQCVRPESCFLWQFGFTKENLEAFGYKDFLKEVLVWHTKTSKSKEDEDVETLAGNE
ncbi:unnamed protein product [Angiostrongylus costaricensis]|uniref:Galactosylgalactosylxylosylprotein 3-beta-glucuronosyltransferase n=1 Tax=Angiostrongylus costaricensis TaxID=334426 RepID=A0A0R3PVE2_ANGCS|nr:unnamed protein product [Angiostrongylus costaricensis]